MDYNITVRITPAICRARFSHAARTSFSALRSSTSFATPAAVLALYHSMPCTRFLPYAHLRTAYICVTPHMPRFNALAFSSVGLQFHVPHVQLVLLLTHIWFSIPYRIHTHCLHLHHTGVRSADFVDVTVNLFVFVRLLIPFLAISEYVVATRAIDVVLIDVVRYYTFTLTTFAFVSTYLPSRFTFFTHTHTCIYCTNRLLLHTTRGFPTHTHTMSWLCGLASFCGCILFDLPNVTVPGVVRTFWDVGYLALSSRLLPLPPSLTACRPATTTGVR